MKVYIKALSYYLPERIVTNAELLKDFPEWSVDKVTAKVGVTSRHLAADNETAGDLAEKAARRLFEEYGISPSEIDYFIFHQANKFMLNTIRKVCVLPKEKFYVSLENTGNTVSSTVLIGLKACLLNGTIKAGMQVVVAGFGVGLSWGGTILKFSNQN